MEKFYIVTNEKFLEEIEEYKKSRKARNDLIKEFFEKHQIHGEGYLIHGNGWVNTPFDEMNKTDISLYIDGCEENGVEFKTQLKKLTVFSDGSKMFELRKNSSILKEFQDLCIQHQVVINLHWHREGDYFKGLDLGGYSVTRFVQDGKYYLRMEAERHDSLTPKYDGFTEIKGSEFYTAMENYDTSN